MKITILTLFPKMVSGFFEESIISRAIKKKAVEINVVDLRSFAQDKHRSVDDKPYAGGAGMILKVEILYRALQSLSTKKTKIVLTSAKGKRYDQGKAEEYSKLDDLLIICGHYEGVDERFLDLIHEEISLGDFVMTGGEITASAIVDSVVRLLPGVLKKKEAVTEESFFEVDLKKVTDAIGETKLLKNLKNSGVKKLCLLEYPHYTRPEIFKRKKVPPVLLSGDLKKIKSWRIQTAYKQTLKKRPDFLTLTYLQKKSYNA